MSVPDVGGSYSGGVSDFPPPPSTGQSVPPPPPLLPPAVLSPPSRVLGRRIAAGFLDLVPVSVLAFGLADRTSDAGFDIELRGARFLLVGLVALLYHFVSELLTGTTLGKRILGLRVVGADARPVGAGAIAIRTAFRVVDGLPAVYLLGVIVAAATPNQQRVGDIVAKTRVVADADAIDQSPRPGWHLPLLAGLASLILVVGIATAAGTVNRSGDLGGYDIDSDVRSYATALADGPFADLDANAIEAEMLERFTEGDQISATIDDLRELVGEVESFTLRDENVVRDTRIIELGGYVDAVEYWFDGTFERGEGTLLITVFVDDGELTMLGWNMNCSDCVGS